MLTFSHCTLLMTARSPYARRVRVAFIEHGVDYEEKWIDVFNPPAELKALNPLLRIPVAILKDGRAIVDSHQILQAFYGKMEWSPMFPRSDEERELVHRWSGIAVGLCDKVVEYYLETLRPEASRDQSLFKEIESVVTNVLAEFETAVADRTSLIKGIMTQADLDMGTALDYLTLRHPMPWQKSFPKSETFLKVIRARPSFEVTKPPPP